MQFSELGWYILDCHSNTAYWRATIWLFRNIEKIDSFRELSIWISLDASKLHLLQGYSLFLVFYLLNKINVSVFILLGLSLGWSGSWSSRSIGPSAAYLSIRTLSLAPCLLILDPCASISTKCCIWSSFVNEIMCEIMGCSRGIWLEWFGLSRAGLCKNLGQFSKECSDLCSSQSRMLFMMV